MIVGRRRGGAVDWRTEPNFGANFVRAHFLESSFRFVDKIFDGIDALSFVECKFAAPKPPLSLAPKLLLHKVNRDS